jgi:hypothetical protein
MSTVWPLRRLLGLLVLVALLLAPGGTHAAGTAPGRTPPADSLSAAAVGIGLAVGVIVL